VCNVVEISYFCVEIFGGIMKVSRRAVGEISKTGWSSFVKEVEEKGEVIVLYRFNEPVAVMMPCDSSFEAVLQVSAGATIFANSMQEQGTPEVLMRTFLRSIVECAATAKVMLGEEVTNEVEKNVISLLSKNSQKGETSSAGEQLVAPSDEEEGMPVVSPNLFNETSSPKRKTPPQRGVRKAKTRVKK
jgi:hypothetical protein